MGVGVARYSVHCGIEVVGNEQEAMRQVQKPARHRRGVHERNASPEFARAAYEPFGDVRFGRILDGRFR
jgi:hypothetical protein